MKRKWMLPAAAGLLVILLAVLVAVAFSLGSMVKKGVETIGPNATGVDVKLSSAKVWLLTCRVQLNGLVVGNPPGCKSPSAMSVDKVSVRVRPGSVFSDKLVVESIKVTAPVITLEGGLTDNNLKRIEQNLNDYIGSSATAPNASATSSGSAQRERKLQVNELEITGAKLQVNSTLLGGRTITLSIPDIHLTDFGTGAQGVTAAEVGQQTLRAVLDAAATAVAKNTSGLGGAKGAIKKVTDTLKGLFH